jgi:hypothetical protein
MTGLFEKLKQRKQSGAMDDEMVVDTEVVTYVGTPCNCGAHLLGECPECDAQDTEPAVMKRLRTIGATQGVNRPVDDNPPGEGVCPLCGKTFKILSRHKCKEALPPPAEQGADSSEGGATVVYSCKKCGKPLVIELADGVQTEVLPHTKDYICLGCTAQGQPGIQPDGRYLTPPERVAQARAQEVPPAPAQEAPPGHAPGRQVALKSQGSAKMVAAQPTFILIIDAVMTKGAAVQFDDFILPFCEAVAKENQLDHWSLAEYGRGPGLLAAKIDRSLQAEPFVGTMMALDSAELRAVKAVLKRYASVVIQGVR